MVAASAATPKNIAASVDCQTLRARANEASEAVTAGGRWLVVPLSVSQKLIGGPNHTVSCSLASRVSDRILRVRRIRFACMVSR